MNWWWENSLSVKFFVYVCQNHILIITRKKRTLHASAFQLINKMEIEKSTERKVEAF